MTFFDIRSAEAAVNGLRNFTAYGRHPVIDYSYKPPNYSKIDPRVYSSLVKVVSNKPLKMDEIKNEFSKFGEISEIKEIDSLDKLLIQLYTVPFDGVKLLSVISFNTDFIASKDDPFIYIKALNDLILLPYTTGLEITF